MMHLCITQCTYWTPLVVFLKFRTPSSVVICLSIYLTLWPLYLLHLSLTNLPDQWSLYFTVLSLSICPNQLQAKRQDFNPALLKFSTRLSRFLYEIASRSWIDVSPESEIFHQLLSLSKNHLQHAGNRHFPRQSPIRSNPPYCTRPNLKIINLFLLYL